LEATTDGLRILEVEQNDASPTFFRSFQKHSAALMLVKIYPSNCQRIDYKLNILNGAKYQVKS
jgi:hypothetical protein